MSWRSIEFYDNMVQLFAACSSGLQRNARPVKILVGRYTYLRCDAQVESVNVESDAVPWRLYIEMFEGSRFTRDGKTVFDYAFNDRLRMAARVFYFANDLKRTFTRRIAGKISNGVFTMLNAERGKIWIVRCAINTLDHRLLG